MLVDAQTSDRASVETHKFIVTETVFLALFKYLEVFLYQFRVKFDGNKIQKFKLAELLEALQTHLLPASELCRKLLSCVVEQLNPLFYAKTTNVFDANLKNISKNWISCLETELEKAYSENHILEDTKTATTILHALSDPSMATIFFLLWKGNNFLSCTY